METGRSDSRRRDEVQEFLDRFARAVTAGDARAIAGMWALPALVMDDQSVRAVSSPAEVEQFFAGAKEQYNKMGITDTRAEILDLEWLTDRIAMVDVRWPYLDRDGAEKGEETSTYALRRDDNDTIKLQAAIMRGATNAVR